MKEPWIYAVMHLFPIVFSSHPKYSDHQLLSGCNNYQAFVSPCSSNVQVHIATNQVPQSTKVLNTYSFSSVRLDLKYKTSKFKGFFCIFDKLNGRGQHVTDRSAPP